MVRFERILLLVACFVDVCLIVGMFAFLTAKARGADLRIPRERHAVSKHHLTAAPAYEPYFKGLPNKLNPKEPPVERPAGLP